MVFLVQRAEYRVLIALPITKSKALVSRGPSIFLSELLMHSRARSVVKS